MAISLIANLTHRLEYNESGVTLVLRSNVRPTHEITDREVTEYLGEANHRE